MKKDQREAEEVTMKVYLHKIILKNNLFSSTGFSLGGSGSAITRRIEDEVEMVQSRAITSFEAGRIEFAAMEAGARGERWMLGQQ